jgi:positive regulator of sigma E activity
MTLRDVVEILTFLFLVLSIPAQIIVSIFKRPWIGFILPIVMAIFYIISSLEFFFWESIGLVGIYLIARLHYLLIYKLEKRKKRTQQEKLKIKDL